MVLNLTLMYSIVFRYCSIVVQRVLTLAIVLLLCLYLLFVRRIYNFPYHGRSPLGLLYTLLSLSYGIRRSLRLARVQYRCAVNLLLQILTQVIIYLFLWPYI